MVFLLLTIGSIAAGVILHLLARLARRQITQRTVPVPAVRGQVILLGILALVTLGLSLLGWSFFTTNSVDVNNWDTTDGTVRVLEVVTEAADRGFSFSGNVNEDLYYVRLEYAYQVDGADYVGFQRVPNERLFDGQFLQLEPDELASIQVDYAVGTAVTVHYNPADPAEAALENDNRTPYLVLGGTVGSVAGILTGIFALPIALFMLHGGPSQERGEEIPARIQ